MIRIYNVCYLLKELDSKFNLKLLLNASCYLPTTLNNSKLMSIKGYDDIKDIKDRQFNFMYSVNNDKFSYYYDTKKNLVIDRSSKMANDLSRIRSTLINEIHKSLYDRIIYNDKKLSDDIVVFDKSIVVQKYDSLDDIHMLTSDMQKVFFLYTVAINGDKVNLIFKMVDDMFVKTITKENFIKNIDIYFKLLGYGINENDYNLLFNDNYSESTPFIIPKLDYIESISDSRDLFIKEVHNKYNIFMLKNGVILDLPKSCMLYFKDIPPHMVISFLNRFTNEYITEKDILNFLNK